MSNRKRVIYLLLAVAMLLATNVLPLPHGLTRSGLHALGLLSSCVILWVTKAMPLILSSLMGLVAMPYLGILPMEDVWSSFSSQVLFFTLASFGISAGFAKTNLPQVLVKKVFLWSRGNTRKIVFGFFAATAVVSAFISDIPAVVIFAEIAAGLLEDLRESRDTPTGFAKALMIAIPAGALMGGASTPAGNSLNVMIMSGLQSMTGQEITFLSWSIVGIPIAVISVFGAWKILCMVFRPQPIDQEILTAYAVGLGEKAQLDAKDRKFLAIMGVTVLAWFAGTWVPSLNIAVIALCAVAAMLLPGIEIMNGEDFVKGVNWEIFVMVGCIIAIGHGVYQTGAITWCMDIIASNTSALPKIAVLAIISLIPCVLHICLPLAGVIYALAFFPVMQMAIDSGIDGAVAAKIFGIWMNSEYILPTDTIILLSFGYGYFSSKDLAKAGVWITLMIFLLTVLVCPLVGTILTHF